VALRRDAASLRDRAALAPGTSGFGAALSHGTAVSLIAEIKRRSPSRGDIAPGIDAAHRARMYSAAGASALSVLTEPTQFGGSLSDLDAASASGLPLLRKDFIVDRLQLLEAKVHGASAVLLIVRALPATQLADLHAEAASLSLEVLVEVHDEDEMHQALDAAYPIIGVNNRDLESLEIDESVGERLVPQIPPSAIAVYESGIRSRSGVERAAACGADAVLVGTALSSSTDAETAVRALTGVPRAARHAS
jgi:indole-3-glycerol phosphate synthase